jgi:integrase
MSRTALPVTVGDRPFTVRVTAARGLVSCQWRVKGKRCTKSWPDSPRRRAAALQWAKDYAAERRKIARTPVRIEAPLTLAALWARYRAANAADWRPKTAKGYAAHAATVIDLLDGKTLVIDIGLEDLDAFKAAQRGRGIAHAQVRRQIGFVRQLVNWAEGRELLTRNRLRAYRYTTPKDEQGEEPAEYSREQLLAIAAELAKPQHWRARAAITIAGSLGPRINAVLHLCWPDVDFTAGTVTWQPEWDKLGKRRVQPLTAHARVALEEALTHRHPTEAWVFWAVKTRGRITTTASTITSPRRSSARASCTSRGAPSTACGAWSWATSATSGWPARGSGRSHSRSRRATTASAQRTWRRAGQRLRASRGLYRTSTGATTEPKVAPKAIRQVLDTTRVSEIGARGFEPPTSRPIKITQPTEIAHAPRLDVQRNGSPEPRNAPEHAPRTSSGTSSAGTPRSDYQGEGGYPHAQGGVP